MLCGLGEEECTKFRKQKMKKEKKLNAAKSVGRDDRVSGGFRGGMGGMHPPHQPKSYDFGRKISPYFE